MQKYVRVDWPESQKWEGRDECFTCPMNADWIESSVFVPIELYNAEKVE